MANRWLAALALAVLLPIFSSCATTRVFAEDDEADIYMDENLIGREGNASIGSVGPPHTAILEARHDGEVVGRTTMSRQFKFETILWGMISYYSGLYWGWYYPEEVVIPWQKPAQKPDWEKNRPSPWDQPRASIWMKPLQAK